MERPFVIDTTSDFPVTQIDQSCSRKELQTGHLFDHMWHIQNHRLLFVNWPELLPLEALPQFRLLRSCNFK